MYHKISLALQAAECAIARISQMQCSLNAAMLLLICKDQIFQWHTDVENSRSVLSTYEA